MAWAGYDEWEPPNHDGEEAYSLMLGEPEYFRFEDYPGPDEDELREANRSRRWN